MQEEVFVDEQVGLSMAGWQTQGQVSSHQGQIVYITPLLHDNAY